MDIADLEEQLEGANRVKEDGLRQLKKYQQQVKDIQRDLDEARHARDEISEQAKENERKAKQLEADYLQMQEVRSGRLETAFRIKWLLLVPVPFKYYPSQRFSETLQRSVTDCDCCRCVVSGW